MNVYIFLGPSLPVEEAKKILDAHYLPPVAGGDVQQLMARSPEVIGIIDGLFEQTAAVFHKEILYALSRGVRVFGASSMGALRAAELHSFGMIGVGKIFELFRSGALEDDDEVAVSHGTAEQGYQPVSEAMVNLRDGLARARAEQVISGATCEALLRAAKAAFYTDRSWKRLLHEAPGLGVPAPEVRALQDFIARERPNLKREDALRLLEQIASGALDKAREAAPTFTFNQTSFWRANRDESLTIRRYLNGVIRDHQRDPPIEAFDLHARLFSEDVKELVDRSSFYWMVNWLSEWNGLVVTEDEMSQQIEKMGVAASDVAQEPVRSLARLEVLAEKLRVIQIGANRTFSELYLPLALLHKGRLSSTIEQVQRQWEWLRSRGLAQPSLSTSGVDEAKLLEWYRARSDLKLPSFEAYAEALELSVYDFVTELLRTYLFEQRADSK